MSTELVLYSIGIVFMCGVTYNKLLTCERDIKAIGLMVNRINEHIFGKENK